MGVSIEPCQLHEITNCSICTGLDKAEATAEWREDEALVRDSFFLPAGHVYAKWGGNCGNCGTAYERGAVIRFSKTTDGWVGMECC